MGGACENKDLKLNPAQNQVLHSAVKENNLNFVKLLQKNGTNVNTIDKSGKTALMWASRLGYADIVTFLLDSGADFKLEDISGMTAVHEAAISGRLETLKILDQYGADLEATTKGGQTPLHFAANGFYDVTKFLLDKDVNLQRTDCNGYGAIHWAVSVPNNNIEIIEIILEKGGTNMLNDTNIPPIFIAARTGEVKTLMYLKKKGAIMSLTLGEDEFTVIHEACSYDRVEAVKYLLTIGLKPNVQDADGWTPLHVVSAKGFTHLALLLLSSGAEIDAKTHRGSTPLKLAVLNKKQPLVELLVVNKADVNAEDNQGKTILEVASKNDNIKMILYLTDNGADFSKKTRKIINPNKKIGILIEKIMKRESSACKNFNGIERVTKKLD